MLVVDYGYCNLIKEDETTIAKAKHFVESVKNNSSICYQIKRSGDIDKHVTYIALSNNLQLEIKINIERDEKSIEILNELKSIRVDRIYSPEILIKNQNSLLQSLNLDNDTIQCSKCSKQTIDDVFCVHCGQQINSKTVTFCKNCKDYMVYASHYKCCPKCGDQLLEHPDKDMHMSEFDSEELLYGHQDLSDKMDYEKIIPKSTDDSNMET
jgi:hypothetical protein